MARVTVEDCVEKVPNRFHRLQRVTIRTKQRRKGAKPLVDGQTNKAVGVAPREIAAGYVKPDDPAASSETRSHGEFDTEAFRVRWFVPHWIEFPRKKLTPRQGGA